MRRNYLPYNMSAPSNQIILHKVCCLSSFHWIKIKKNKMIRDRNLFSHNLISGPRLVSNQFTIIHIFYNLKFSGLAASVISVGIRFHLIDCKSARKLWRLFPIKSAKKKLHTYTWLDNFRSEIWCVTIQRHYWNREHTCIQ